MKTCVVALVSSVFLGVVLADLTSLQWSDCGSDPALTLEKIDVHPMPVVLPGDMKLTIKASSTRPQIDQLKLVLHMKRDTFLLNIPIPCLLHVGSCTYDNTCTLLQTMEKENWAGIMGGIGHQILGMLASVNITSMCPITQQSIDIQDYTITLPKVPAILSWFAEGDYEAKVQALDAKSGSQLLCLNLKLTVKEKKDSSGWLFG